MPRSTGADPQGTRDARDDATMIAWLATINSTLVANLKQTPSLRPGDPTRPRQPDEGEGIVRDAREAAKHGRDAAVEFSRVLTQALGQLGRVMTPFVEMFRSLGTLLRGLVMPGFLNVPTTPAASQQRAEDAARETINRRMGPSPVRRMGEGLAGTTAEHEYTWRGIRSGMSGMGEPPPIRGAGTSHDQAMKSIAAALTQRGAASMATAAAVGGASGAGAGAGAAAGGAAAGAGAVAASGPLAPIALAALAAGVVLTAFAVIVTKAAGLMSDMNRQLAQFSPSMAAVFAQSHIRDVQRNMRLGEATAGTAGGLERSFSDLKDVLANISQPLRNIANILLKRLVETVTILLKPIEGMALALDKLLEWLHLKGEDKTEGIGVGQWLDDLRDEERERQKRLGFGTGPRPGFAGY